MSSSSEARKIDESLYRVENSDPHSELVDRSGLSDEDVAQINRMMVAMGSLREAEDQLTDASTRYMKLNKTDMRALHFLIVCEHRGTLATPGDIATHLGITTASTTKLLDRLARAGHITREPHPSDRRALVVHITPETHRSAMNTVGRQQARRFAVAARRTPEQREVIISFLEETARELSVTGQSWAAE
jgi:DNA-binding MarR family transcriptional regulator